MNAKLKSNLVDKMQEFLDDDENADLIGGEMGVWQDDTHSNENAHLMAKAAFNVLEAMALQYKLERRFNN